MLKECAVNAKLPNLTLIPAGRPVRNPLVLLTSPAFLELLEEAKKHYDVVMIDSPPLLPVVDTKILRRMADMVLFVVRADATPRDGVVRSLAGMRGVAGVVFNQVSPGSFRRYYYYDAYSRYAYGDPPGTRRQRRGGAPCLISSCSPPRRCSRCSRSGARSSGSSCAGRPSRPIGSAKAATAACATAARTCSAGSSAIA